MKLHEISVKRPIAVIMSVLVFVVIGLYSLSKLSMEMMPEMELSMAIVYTSYPNVGSEEVENLVTKNIEAAIASVSGVNSISSSSSEGTSMIMVEFTSSTDIDDAVQSLSDSINMIEDYFPEDVEDPMIIKLDTSSMLSTAMMSTTYEGYSPAQTKKFIEDNIEDKLKSVNGVASVNISGATDRIIEVTLNPEKMYGYNLSANDIATAITIQNQNLPSGSTEGMNKDLAIRTEGKFSNLHEIENVPITTSKGELIHLSDVAIVTDTYKDATSYARLNGNDAISISINKESDANTVEVVNGIKEELKKIKAEYPKFSYEIIMEQASYIENSINSVASSAVTGGILAIIILLLFLGSVKTSLVIGISMPVSIIVTFIGMFFSGMTLNVVSLGGLALGVGMLVDNAVVVIENIFRRRDVYKENPKEAAIKGTGEIIGAVVASVLTTCIVYVPILFIDNMMAVMFKQLAFAIIFSQIASLLTTFLIIPMLSSKIKYTEGRGMLSVLLKPFNAILSGFYFVYEKALKFVIRHRKLTIFVVLGTFVFSMVQLGRLGMTLMPTSDEGALSVGIELPAGAKLESTNAIALDVEKIISQNPNVESIFSTVGSGGTSGMLGASTGNQATLTVTLKDNRTLTTDEIVNDLRDSLKDITGATLTLESSNSAMASMASNEVQYNYTAVNEDELKNYIIEAEKVLKTVDGVVETSTSIQDTQPEIKVQINSSKAARFGMNTTGVSSAISSVLGNTSASRYLSDGSEYDIVLAYPDSYISDYNQLKTLRIKTPTGQWIALSDIADVNIESGSTTLNRVDQKRVYTLSAKIFDTDMQTVNTIFDEKMNEIPKPDGIAKQDAGTFEIMMDAMTSLLYAILLGILLMYMIMCAQFENLKQPFIILFTIPLAMIGVVLALCITDSPLSVVGCIGILMLMGIIVNNAIVLIDFINTAKIENPDMTREEILVYSGKARMRPILMTSLTSILGFLPMAISTAEGSEMMQPLAVVLCGGLLVGTFLTLFFIPTVYASFDIHDERKKDKKEKRALKKKKEEINV